MIEKAATILSMNISNTKKGEEVAFFTSLVDGKSVRIVVFPGVLSLNRNVFKVGQTISFRGKYDEENEVYFPYNKIHSIK